MNRREFIKGLLAIIAVSQVPVALTEAQEIAIADQIPFNVPVGYIGWIQHNGETICVLSTDKGARILDGGRLSIDEFPELFSMLKYQFGGNSDHFYLPDYRGLYPKRI